MSCKPTGGKSGRPKKALPKPGQRPQLRDWQWDALRVEVEQTDWSKKPWPSRATLAEVATAVDKSREWIRQCRLSPDYQQGFIWVFFEEGVQPVLDEIADHGAPIKKLPQRLKTGRAKRQGDPLQRSVAKYERDAALYVCLKSDWCGPIKSMLNGKIYHDPKSYFEHIVSYVEPAQEGDGDEKEPGHPSHVWVGDADEWP